MGVGLLVIQLHVLMDEVHLADLHDLDGHEEGDGYQHLGEDREILERRYRALLSFRLIYRIHAVFWSSDFAYNDIISCKHRCIMHLGSMKLSISETIQ